MLAPSPPPLLSLVQRPSLGQRSASMSRLNAGPADVRAGSRGGSRPGTPGGLLPPVAAVTPPNARRRKNLHPLGALEPLPADFSTASAILAGSPARAMRRAASASSLLRPSSRGQLSAQPLVPIMSDRRMPTSTTHSVVESRPLPPPAHLRPDALEPEQPKELPPPSPREPSEASFSDSEAAEVRAREALQKAVSAGYGEDVDLLKVKARQALQQALQSHRRPPDVGTPAPPDGDKCEACLSENAWTHEEVMDIKRKARAALFGFVESTEPKGARDKATGGGADDAVGATEAKEEAEPPAELGGEAFEHAKQRARLALDAVLLVESGTIVAAPPEAPP